MRQLTVPGIGPTLKKAVQQTCVHLVDTYTIVYILTLYQVLQMMQQI